MKVKSTQPVKAQSKEVSEHLGSYPGDGAGDRAVGAPGTEIRVRRVSERAGRNASEAWAGPERLNASAESPLVRRRPPRSIGSPDA